MSFLAPNVSWIHVLDITSFWTFKTTNIDDILVYSRSREEHGALKKLYAKFWLNKVSFLEHVAPRKDMSVVSKVGYWHMICLHKAKP
jgi:hypothetical protein